MTLFRNFAILRQHYGNPCAPIQILTGDTREGCNSRHSRLHDERRSFQRKSRIERRFESLPGVQRAAALGVFLRYLLHAAKSNNPFPFREVRGFANLESAHPNNNFARTKLNPLREASRFCKPRFSSPQWRLRTNKIKSFAALRRPLSYFL